MPNFFLAFPVETHSLIGTTLDRGLTVNGCQVIVVLSKNFRFNMGNVNCERDLPFLNFSNVVTILPSGSTVKKW